MNTQSRTLIFALSLTISLACLATTAIIWQWGLMPALDTRTPGDITLYSGMFVTVGIATIFSTVGTIYYGVRSIVLYTHPGLIEGISR